MKSSCSSRKPKNTVIYYETVDFKMYKLAALAFTAIGIFSLGIIHLSKNQMLQLAPTSVDFETSDVTGAFVVYDAGKNVIRGRLSISNSTDQPIKVDLSKFNVAFGNQIGVMHTVLSPLHQVDPSGCDPILGLGLEFRDEKSGRPFSQNQEIVFIEANQEIDREVVIVFNRKMQGGVLQIVYPIYYIDWLADSVA